MSLDDVTKVELAHKVLPRAVAAFVNVVTLPGADQTWIERHSIPPGGSHERSCLNPHTFPAAEDAVWLERILSDYTIYTMYIILLYYYDQDSDRVYAVVSSVHAHHRSIILFCHARVQNISLSYDRQTRQLRARGGIGRRREFPAARRPVSRPADRLSSAPRSEYRRRRRRRLRRLSRYARVNGTRRYDGGDNGAR